MKTFILLFILSLMLGSAALANQPALGAISITMESQQPVSLLIYPDGSGPALTEAMVADGATVDATITVMLVDEFLNPVVYFPSEDVWLDTEDTNISTCGSNFLPDAISDSSGRMTFSQAFAGGGHHQGETFVYINGWRAESMVDYPWSGPLPGVDLHFNSPDINADGVINLLDLTIFSADFFGAYHYRSDFNWDGELNILDVGRYAAGLGVSCQ